MSIQIRVLESSDTGGDIPIPEPQELIEIASTAEYDAIKLAVTTLIEYSANCGQRSCTFQTPMPESLIQELKDSGFTVKLRGFTKQSIDVPVYTEVIHHPDEWIVERVEYHHICQTCGYDLEEEDGTSDTDSQAAHEHEQEHIDSGETCTWELEQVQIRRFVPAHDEEVSHGGEVKSKFIRCAGIVYDIYW